MPSVKVPKVTIIPAKKNQLPINVLSNEAIKRLRVAAYARVSTNNEEQLTSYEAQGTQPKIFGRQWAQYLSALYETDY